MLVHHDETFLYFMHGNSERHVARLARARFVDGAFETPTDLALADPYTDMLAWPCPVEWNDQITMAYDHFGAHQEIAVGDGVTFGAPTELASGVQARVASMANGTLAVTWQNGTMENMVAYVRVSTDGTSWSAAQPITSKSNVHDTSPFRRADGGVDLYYISSDGSPGFRIWRRAVHADATLGPEELVTTDVSFTRPHPLDYTTALSASSSRGKSHRTSTPILTSLASKVAHHRERRARARWPRRAGPPGAADSATR